MSNVLLSPMMERLHTLDVPEWYRNEKVIESEPMLHGCGIDQALAFGGPITNMALSQIIPHLPELPEHSPHYVIDTKSTMLMPGMYPCIPGWHCDAVRREGENFQPNLHLARDSRWHYQVYIQSGNGHLSDTLLLSGMPTLAIEEPPAEGNVWKYVDETIDGAIRRGKIDSLHLVQARPNELLRFNSHTPHKGMPAQRRGWRWWMRISMYPRPPVNKRRHQVQVYTDLSNGW